MNKIKEVFGNSALNKSADSAALLNFLELPAEVKNWLLMKFSDEDGLDAFKISQYVKSMRLKVNEWNIKLLEARHSKKEEFTILTKVKVSFETAKDIICFSLPEYGFPKKATEAQVDWSVIADNKAYLLNPDGAWGELTLCFDCGIVQLKEFVPLCPYSYTLEDLMAKRAQFTTSEWLDVLLGGMNFNPAAFRSTEEKLILLQRFLPFVEKRLNTIELATKGTGKSYCYSQLSPYTWCVNGGSVSRATAFFDLTRKKPGYFADYSQIIFDEVQTIKFANPEEIGGALKSYLESGEIRVGGFECQCDSGLTLVGNIPESQMDTKKGDMFKTLPKVFHESALIDRFHGIVEGWKIPRMCENMKMEGWSISTDYLMEMFEKMREEFYYRAIVDQLIDELIVDKKSADTRNLEAVKRLCTAYMKILFPYVTSKNQIQTDEFITYCLKPALRMRENVLFQLRKLDKEYEDKEMPEFKGVA